MPSMFVVARGMCMRRKLSFFQPMMVAVFLADVLQLFFAGVFLVHATLLFLLSMLWSERMGYPFFVVGCVLLYLLGMLAGSSASLALAVIILGGRLVVARMRESFHIGLIAQTGITLALVVVSLALFTYGQRTVCLMPVAGYLLPNLLVSLLFTVLCHRMNYD